MSLVEFRDGKPATPGIYETRRDDGISMELTRGYPQRQWNGGMWSAPWYADDPAGIVSRARATVGESQTGFVWRPLSWPGDVRSKAAIPAPTPLATLPGAPDLLDAAAKHIRDRASTYDKPAGERSMPLTVEVFNKLTGHDLTESDGWTLMLILKLVRDRTGDKPHRDSIEDSISYGALRGEARLAGR